MLHLARGGDGLGVGEESDLSELRLNAAETLGELLGRPRLLTHVRSHTLEAAEAAEVGIGVVGRALDAGWHGREVGIRRRRVYLDLGQVGLQATLLAREHMQALRGGPRTLRLAKNVAVVEIG